MPTIDPFGKLLATKLQMDQLERQKQGDQRQRQTEGALRFGMQQQMPNYQTDPQGFGNARQNMLSRINTDYPQADPSEVMGAFPNRLASMQQGGGNQAFAPQKMVDSEGNITFGAPVFNKGTGQFEMQPLGMEGYSPLAESGETKTDRALREAQGKQDIKTGSAREQKEEEVTGAKAAARTDAYITAGVEAADQIATIERGLQLIEAVSTGGYDKWANTAKRFLGVETANEAEFSYHMGKKVLGQLKATFGAQFTEKEGQRLENLEAGWGKSTAGNRRILKESLAISRRAANRGIKAARASGQDKAVKTIQESMAFRLPQLSEDTKGVDQGIRGKIDNTVQRAGSAIGDAVGNVDLSKISDADLLGSF